MPGNNRSQAYIQEMGESRASSDDFRSTVHHGECGEAKTYL